ncbi:hypothetical protein RJZ56_005425 [Blastomyces dermatitidis]
MIEYAGEFLVRCRGLLQMSVRHTFSTESGECMGDHSQVFDLNMNTRLEMRYGKWALCNLHLGRSDPDPPIYAAHHWTPAHFPDLIMDPAEDSIVKLINAVCSEKQNFFKIFKFVKKNCHRMIVNSIN